MYLLQVTKLPPKTTSFRPVIPIPLITNLSLFASHVRNPLPRLAIPQPNPEPEPEPEPKPKPKSRTRRRRSKPEPNPIPRKAKRGRKSEAAAVEDFIRQKIETTFETIRQQNPEGVPETRGVMKDRAPETRGFEESEEEEEKEGKGKMFVEEERSDWPLDADVGWGIRASEYFEKHSIRNVVGEDGVEIDWEGELEDGWVKEINCLEWESFAFHPSPLVVLVFERYNKASDNWKMLKELEKAAKVYWSAKDRLPPRTVKLDINIERDLAYALKVKECPQILFLRGHRIIHREKELRTADELVHMIAHFYYNAKKPLCMKDGD